MAVVTPRGRLIAGLVAAVALLLGSAGAVVAWSSANHDSSRAVTWGGNGGRAGMLGPRSGTDSSVPDLPGTVVHAVVGDMGGPMMRGNDRSAASMYLHLDRTTVPHGTVSFVVTNAGMRNHELVVLPLDGDQRAGSRVAGTDRRIDESGSLGEVADAGGGSGDSGIAPGATGWVTLDLPAGRYELVCNLPGHYAAGMFAEITVT
ncbi:plastocyanin/azurin family copper-binding protein [Cellulomonas sp. WB94]|uniref:plastocyanin/azurin family copper-binding protein n=1 Tax=Cellulomonas sp. WB94 TaxID=2173174 RepID=UPI0013050012|nr:plastocyanin/azurin family copper-binding protein [Cellulomonas sp. WB94]